MSFHLDQTTDIQSKIREEFSALAPNIFQRTISNGCRNLPLAQYCHRESAVRSQRDLPTGTKCDKVCASLTPIPNHSTKQAIGVNCQGQYGQGNSLCQYVGPRDLLKIIAVRFSGLSGTVVTTDPLYAPLMYRCCVGRASFTRNYHGCMRRRRGQSNDY